MEKDSQLIFSRKALLGFCDQGDKKSKKISEMEKIKNNLYISDAFECSIFPKSLTGLWGHKMICIKNADIFWFCFDNVRSVVIADRILDQPLYVQQITYSHCMRKVLQKGVRANTDRMSELYVQLVIHWFREYLRIFKKPSLKDSLSEDRDIIMVGTLKLSLARLFSREANQELPSGEHYFNVFPPGVRLDVQERSERLRYFFSILQSKNICKDVSDRTVEINLQKHQKSLCRDPQEVIVVPEEYLELCRRKGRVVGRRLRDFYHPGQTTLASMTATCHTPRSKGGCRAELTQLKIDKRPPSRRLEPLVVGLFGPPSSGKTTLLTTLIKELKRILGFPQDFPENLFTYSRSPFTDHWDGYKQQPVVIMDDFGQDTIYGLDFAQFDLAVSSNSFIVPMADLPSKGLEFTSKVILLTSNLKFGEVVRTIHGPPVLDNLSIWRRVKLPFNVLLQPTDEGPVRLFQEIIPNLDDYYSNSQQYYKADPNLSNLNRPRSLGFSDGFRRQSVPYLTRATTFLGLVELIHSTYTSSVERYYAEIGVWPQIVASGHFSVVGSGEDVKVLHVPSTQNEKGYFFPIHPPSNSSCKVVGLKEPLKVRTITAGPSVSRCLKPFQVALLQAIQLDPVFRVTRNATSTDEENDTLLCIEETLRMLPQPKIWSDLQGEDYGYLSGDYISATDNLPFSVTQSLLQGILEEIDHQPTKEWAMWEIGAKTLRYPWGEFTQTNGQLMGSILSFPLLCLANQVLCEWCGFQHFFINGDDLVAVVTRLQEQLWKERGRLIGLAPSPGKYFWDKEFCTLNSQLFFRSEFDQGFLLTTGKFSLIVRGKKTISKTFYEAQRMYGASDILRQQYLLTNLEALKRTPRSLSIPTSHGGLAFVNSGTYDAVLAKKIYFRDLFRRTLKNPVCLIGTDVFLVPVPCFIPEWISQEVRSSLYTSFFREYDHLLIQMRKLMDLAPQEEKQDELTHTELDSDWGKLVSIAPKLPGICKGSQVRLSQLPRLSCFETFYFPVRGKLDAQNFRSKTIQAIIDQVTNQYSVNALQLCICSYGFQEEEDKSEVFVPDKTDGYETFLRGCNYWPGDTLLGSGFPHLTLYHQDRLTHPFWDRSVLGIHQGRERNPFSRLNTIEELFPNGEYNW